MSFKEYFFLTKFFSRQEYDGYFRKLQLLLEMDMSLADLLIKPVQALTRKDKDEDKDKDNKPAMCRYHMFFEELARLSEKGGQVQEAEVYQECAEIARQVPV